MPSKVFLLRLMVGWAPGPGPSPRRNSAGEGGLSEFATRLCPPGIRKSKQNIVRLSRQLYENRQEPIDNWACGNRVYTVMGDSPMKRRLQRWVDRMRECVMLAGWEVRG